MNYHIYKMTLKESLSTLMEYLLISSMISFLFFDSMWFFTVSIPGYFVYRKMAKEKYKKRRDEIIREQFCSMIESVSTSLSAGLSVENAFSESKKEMEKLYGEDSLIVMEISDMMQKINCNKPIEACLKDFSVRSNIQEIKDFSIIFKEAKRSGGSFKDIIQKTVFMIREKTNTEKEIAVLLRGKMLEQKVMNIIPFIIIGYLRLSSKDYIKVLYHNMVGIIVMTGCLLIYAISYIISAKIATIEV